MKLSEAPTYFNHSTKYNTSHQFEEKKRAVTLVTMKKKSFKLTNLELQIVNDK
jgi:hypothetical protein